jgi:hypothetical protein
LGDVIELGRQHANRRWPCCDCIPVEELLGLGLEHSKYEPRIRDMPLRRVSSEGKQIERH